MNSLLERIAVWTFFFAMLAIVVALGYATLHLTLNTATTAEMNARFDKVDAQIEKVTVQLQAIRSDIASVRIDNSEKMLNHVSQVHVKP